MYNYIILLTSCGENCDCTTWKSGFFVLSHVWVEALRQSHRPTSLKEGVWWLGVWWCMMSDLPKVWCWSSKSALIWTKRSNIRIKFAKEHVSFGTHYLPDDIQFGNTSETIKELLEFFHQVFFTITYKDQEVFQVKSHISN